MGLMKSAFNSACRIHSRPVIMKRLATPSSPVLFSPARATPSNYFRYLTGPSETVISGSEFVIPVSSIAGTQVQLISFSSVPTTGTWTLSYGVASTTDLNFDAVAADVQVALRLLSGLESVVVSGDYTAGFSAAMYAIPTPALLVFAGTSLDAVGSLSTLSSGILPSPLIQRGDKIIDGSKSLTVKEIINIPDLGGEIMGYRARCE